MKNGIKLIDNSSNEYQLGSVLKELINDASYSQISIATGYWDLPGMVEIYEELKTFLGRENTSFRLLLGEEPSVKAYQVKNPALQDPDFPGKYLKKDLEDLQLKEEFQKVADLLGKYMTIENTGKLQIKVYRKNFLHAKCYIFGTDEENAVGVIGSSNFTKQGLFGNLELNQFEDNNATVNFIRKNVTQHPSHRTWFEELWNDSEHWAQTFKEEILQLSKHGNLCFSAYEMYIHALYKIYGQDIEDENASKVLNDGIEVGKPQLLTFQIKNANSIIKKLERQQVAMLSDSVGLGKTYTACKIIEYYQSQNRVVVICPASLKYQWTQAFGDFRMKHIPEIYSVANTGEVEKIREDLRNIPVGLFVFDESHNLRSRAGQRFEIFTSWIQDNPQAHTLLVTATPINNQLNDLTSQIILGTGGETHKLGVFEKDGRKYDIKDRFETMQKELKKQISENKIDYKVLKEQLTPVLNTFIIRRTRQGIEKENPNGLEINGKLEKFPKCFPDILEYKVQNQYFSQLISFAKDYSALTTIYSFDINSLIKPSHLKHPLDLTEFYEPKKEDKISSMEIIYSGILSLGFPSYRYNIYLHKYYGITVEELTLNVDDNRDLSRQIGIYGIFRTIYLKRFESSIFAIHKSILNYEKKLLNFQKYLEKNKKIISSQNIKLFEELLPQYNPENTDPDTLDEIFEKMMFDNEDFTFVDADEGRFNIVQLKLDIEKDLSIIKILKQQLELLLGKDDKIKILANKLDEYSDKKVLVFTYFADTLKYLEQYLPPLLRHNKNIEFALGNKNDVEHFACRFSPVGKKYRMKNDEKEIQFLCATDKLSEGQNLQDCGIIINYDLHWNPVRMIQRNGRINRIGTKHSEIFVFNFTPAEQLEQYLKLVSRLQQKIDLIRHTIGTDQSVLNEEPMPQEFTEDLYSKDQQKRLEAFNRIFESSEVLGSEDLFLEDLREFDRNPDFTDEYKQEIQNLPKGKWGKFQQIKEEDTFSTLAHLSDKNNKFGYFAAFKQNEFLELINTPKALTRIRTTKENNERFKDVFTNKVATEQAVLQFIEAYDVHADTYQNKYTKPQHDAIAFCFQKMIEYEYDFNDMENLKNTILVSQNVFTNQKMIELIRLVARKLRKEEHVESAIFDEMIRFSKKQNPLKTDKVVFNEIIQIYSK